MTKNDDKRENVVRSMAEKITGNEAFDGFHGKVSIGFNMAFGECKNFDIDIKQTFLTKTKKKG